MPHHPDVLVIGGGVIGLTTAYFLAREGLQVEVVDQGDMGREASWAGAGILPPGDPGRARTPIDQLRAHSATLFPMLAAELREQTGIDNGYRRCGGLAVPREGEEVAVGRWREEGIRLDMVEGPALQRLEPGLTPVPGRAWHLPDMAQVRSPRHLQALIAGCSLHGVRWRPGCPVQGFITQEKRITAVATAAGTQTAGQYLLAAGAWSNPLLIPLGCDLDIQPVRGQIALLATGAPLLGRIVLQGKRYLVPRPDGRVLVGSTEEWVAFERRPSAGAIADLLALAIQLVPGLAAAHLERCWTGFRPGSPDGLPFLGAVPGFDNLFVAAGHFRAGIQLSPATGLVLKEMLLGQEPTVSLEAFRPDRGPAAAVQLAFQS